MTSTIYGARHIGQELCTPVTAGHDGFRGQELTNKSDAPSATAHGPQTVRSVAMSTVSLTSFFSWSRSPRCSFATASALSEAMRAAAGPSLTERFSPSRPAMAELSVHDGKRSAEEEQNYRCPKPRHKPPTVSEEQAARFRGRSSAKPRPSLVVILFIRCFAFIWFGIGTPIRFRRRPPPLAD